MHWIGARHYTPATCKLEDAAYNSSKDFSEQRKRPFLRRFKMSHASLIGDVGRN